MFCITQHPATRQRLQQEITNFRAAGKLSDHPRYSETTKMLFLLAVLQESRRLFPAANAKFMRCVPPGGATIGGHFIPAETNIGCNAWVLHRNEPVFGADAAIFRPERWLQESENVDFMKKADFSFGMGSRECAGKNMALIEIQKTVVQVSLGPASCRRISHSAACG